MINLETYPDLLIHRTEFLMVMVVLGVFASPLAERGPFAQLVRAGDERVRQLGTKLNRENRSAATLVYRGIVALALLLLPAIIVGAALAKPNLWATVVSTASILLWFGYCFSATAVFTLWRQAKQDKLPLELPNIAYLFADSHAVIRYVIATRMEAFAVGIVGGCFWYVVGGWMTMAMYLTLAAANATYGKQLAFGWAARSLFKLVDAVPRTLSRILIALAAMATPHCRPVASMLAPNWRVAVSKTLGISLGGSGPKGPEPWVGSGKARLTHQHLWRMAYLLGVATILLMASSKSYKLLFFFLS